MRFVVASHRRSATNDALVAAARACGLDSELVDPHRALTSLEPGDAALARLDVREGLDGIECGTGELERLAGGGVDVRNPPAALVVAHDKLLTARTLRFAGLPHPHTTLISPSQPANVPELPLVLKPRFGSWGRDVELCSTPDELDAALIRLQRKPWFREHGALAQELSEPRGWDLRLVERRRRLPPDLRAPSRRVRGRRLGAPGGLGRAARARRGVSLSRTARA